jgi:hypothetical protein
MFADPSSALVLLIFLRVTNLWLAYSLTEGANATAKLSAQLADPAGTKYQYHDGQDDQQFSRT